MTQTTDSVWTLAERVKAMAPADQLRLAAGLIDRGQYDTAETIMDMVNTELQALRLFGKARK